MSKRAIVKDIENRLGNENLEDWIEKKGEEFAALGIMEDGCIHFSRQLLAAANISKIVPDNNSIHDAYLEAIQDQFIIHYNKVLKEKRIRFCIAHEIGHTLWIEKGNKLKPISPFQDTMGSDKNIEMLCNRFASSLLMPKKYFLNAINKMNVSIDQEPFPLHLLPVLAIRYRVAVQAVARRVYHEIRKANTAIFCITNKKGEWRLSWCALPPQLSVVEMISGYSVPAKSSHGRLVHEIMIPDISDNNTKLMSIDGRWADIIKPQPCRTSRKTFSKFPEREDIFATVARKENVIFIAF